MAVVYYVLNPKGEAAVKQVLQSAYSVGGGLQQGDYAGGISGVEKYDAGEEHECDNPSRNCRCLHCCTYTLFKLRI